MVLTACTKKKELHYTVATLLNLGKVLLVLLLLYKF